MVVSQIVTGVVAGLAILLLAAPLSRSTRYGEWVGNIYAAVAMQTLNRPSISIDKRTDLSLRRRAVEERFGRDALADEVKKVLRLTPDSKVRWGNRPFTFVDEHFGVSFDLRDVAVLNQIIEHDHEGDLKQEEFVRNEAGETVDFNAYVRAVVNVSDRDGALSMDLDQSVRPFVDGNEDATAWDRVYEGVKRMFAPYTEPTGILKLALPAVMLFGGLIAGYYLFGPGMLPGTSASRTVDVGAASLLPWLGRGGDGDDSDDDDDPPVYRRASAWLAGVDTVIWHRLLATLGLIAVLSAGVIVAPIATIAISAGVLAVLVLVPLGCSAIISALPALPEPIAEVWLTLGLKAFRDPIINQDDGEIKVREATAIGAEGGPRYRFCKSYVGFDVADGPANFGAAGIKGSKLGEYRRAIADGGENDIPEGLMATTKITNAGHQGLIPTFDATDASATYVRTDRWMSRFADAATGKRCERAQQEATKEFADGSPPFSDRQLIIFSLAGAAAGLGLSFALWGLLL